MQKENEIKFTTNEYVHDTDLVFSDWEKIFSHENIDFTDSENDLETSDDCIKNETSSNETAASSKKGISPFCRTETLCRKTLTGLPCKGRLPKAWELRNHIHTAQNALQTIAVWERDNFASYPRQRFDEILDSENLCILNQSRKTEMSTKQKICPYSVNEFLNTNTSYVDKNFNTQAINIYGHGDQIMNTPCQESLERECESMIVSSQETPESQKMNISSQESSNMNISSQESSKMNICSQESSSSVNISRPKSSAYQTMINLGPENCDIPNQEILESAKQTLISDQINPFNNSNSSNEIFSKTYSILDAHNTNKIKLFQKVSGTINNSSDVKRFYRRYLTRNKRKVLSIRKREMMVARREKAVKIREKLLDVREAGVLKREKAMAAKERQYKASVTNDFYILTNISKNKSFM